MGSLLIDLIVERFGLLAQVLLMSHDTWESIFLIFHGWDMGMATNMELHLMFSSLPTEFMDRIVDDLDVLYCG
jgi:hypothetical protein